MAAQTERQPFTKEQLVSFADQVKEASGASVIEKVSEVPLPVAKGPYLMDELAVHGERTAVMIGNMAQGLRSLVEVSRTEQILRAYRHAFLIAVRLADPEITLPDGTTIKLDPDISNARGK